MFNRRLQELIGTLNMPPLRLTTNITNHIKLDGIDDPRLPKQIAEQVAGREDVLEISFFPASIARRTAEEYRIKLNSSNEFTTYISTFFLP